MIKRINGNFAEWCAEVINGNEFVFLDVESTGLNGDIIEISIISPRGDILYDGLLRPACEIEEEAMAIHHINEAMVSAAPCLHDEWPEIWQRIKGKKLVAWNARFDSGRLKHAAKAHNVDLPPLEWFCAMQEYSHYRHSPKWMKLSQACDHLGIVQHGAHRGLADAIAVLEIFRDHRR